MADVRIEIELDGLERAVRGLDRLESALDDLERAGARVSRSTKGVASAIDKEAKALDRSKTKTQQTTKAKRGLASAIGGTLLKNLNRLGGKLRVTAAALGVFLASVVALRQEIVALGATIGGVLTEIQLENARQRLNSVASSTQVAAEQMRAFRQVANETQTRLTGMVDQMADLSASTQAAGGSFQESVNIMEGFIEAGSSMGQSTSEIADTLESLNEMVKSGTFEIGELAEALEFTNDPVQVLSESLGRSEEVIRDMIDAGARLNRSALIPVSHQLQRQSSISDTLTGAFNELVNAATRLFDIFNQTGVIDAIIQQMGRLTDLLRSAQAEQFIIRLGNAVTDFINNTLPEFVSDTVSSWEAILDTIRGTAGLLIGLAAGGIPGGIIGAIVGAHDGLRKAALELASTTGDVLFDLIKLWNGAKEDISPTAQSIADAISSVISVVRSLASSLKGALQRNDFQSFKNHFTTFLSEALVGAIDKAFDIAVNSFRQNMRDLFKMFPGIDAQTFGGPIGGGGSQTGDGQPPDGRSRPRNFTPMGQLPQKEVVGQPQVTPFRRSQVDMSNILSELRKQLEFLERSKEGWREWAASGMDAIRGIRFNLANLESNMGFFGRAVISVATDFGTLAQSAQRVGGAIQQSMTTAFASVIKGSQSMGDALENAFESIVDALIQELARLAANEVFRIFLDILGIREGPRGSTLGGLVGNRGGGATGTGSLISAGMLGSGGGAAAGTTAAGVGGNVPGLAGTSGTTAAGAGVSMGALAGAGAIFASVLAAEDPEQGAGAAFGGIIGGAFGGPIGAAFGSMIGSALFQTGGSQVVSQPTMIGVGEHGQPEKVTVEPLSGGREGGGGQIVFQGPTIIDEMGMNRFARRISEAQRREQARQI